MLQSRAGRCPHCNEEVSADVAVCPNCGRALSWNKTNEAQRSAAQRNIASGAPEKSSTPSSAAQGSSPFLRLFVLFIIACAATMVAVSIRAKFKTDAPEIEAYHSVLVQDAEEFRTQIAANKTNADAPEVNYVIGSAMPNGKDVLEITVRNEWKTLDYPTRLNYAAKFVERWKAIHAPHRANISILDEDGNEVGGRTWTGTVWVLEKTDEALRRPKPSATPEPENAATENNVTANSVTTTNSAANSVTSSAPSTPEADSNAIVPQAGSTPAASDSNAAS